MNKTYQKRPFYIAKIKPFIGKDIIMEDCPSSLT